MINLRKIRDLNTEINYSIFNSSFIVCSCITIYELYEYLQRTYNIFKILSFQLIEIARSTREIQEKIINNLISSYNNSNDNAKKDEIYKKIKEICDDKISELEKFKLMKKRYDQIGYFGSWQDQIENEFRFEFIIIKNFILKKITENPLLLRNLDIYNHILIVEERIRDYLISSLDEVCKEIKEYDKKEKKENYELLYEEKKKEEKVKIIKRMKLEIEDIKELMENIEENEGESENEEESIKVVILLSLKIYISEINQKIIELEDKAVIEINIVSNESRIKKIYEDLR